jgi:hypothetical protein
LGGDNLKLFTGVFAYLVNRVLAAIADFVFISNIVNDMLTRNVSRYFFTLGFLCRVYLIVFFSSTSTSRSNSSSASLKNSPQPG